MKAAQAKSKKQAKTKNRLDEYHDSLDLLTWWESFQGESLDNGNLKYKTIWAFICAKAKDDWKRKFLYWVLGPLGTSEEYKKYPQFDWETKRTKGKWYESDKLQAFRTELEGKGNALEAMKTVGRFNVSFLQRLDALLQEIDDEYSGRLFLPNLSQKENDLRARSYFALLNNAQQMMHNAQMMYGKTHGLDIERLDVFLQMLQNQQSASRMGFAGSDVIEGEVNKPSTTISQITAMIMSKAAERQLDLPDKDMEDILVNASKPRLVSK